MIREGFSEEVTFEQRSERGRGAAMQRSRGRVFQAGETASARALGWLARWICPRNRNKDLTGL